VKFSEFQEVQFLLFFTLPDLIFELDHLICCLFQVLCHLVATVLRLGP